MKPVEFTCEETIPLPAEEIAEQILDLDNWPGFTGYGPLPGIKRAEYLVRTPEIVGSRFTVENNDGSHHTEEIVAWELPRRMQIRIQEFSPPVSRLAERFDETWEFEPREGGTRVTRKFALTPKSPWTKPLLWLIARLLKRAVAKHLRQIREEA